nr:MAG TPA: hypothetical protein [Caudoviricetes sp.]
MLFNFILVFPFLHKTLRALIITPQIIAKMLVISAAIYIIERSLSSFAVANHPAEHTSPAQNTHNSMIIMSRIIKFHLLSCTPPQGGVPHFNVEDTFPAPMLPASAFCSAIKPIAFCTGAKSVWSLLVASVADRSVCTNQSFIPLIAVISKSGNGLPLREARVKMPSIARTLK